MRSPPTPPARVNTATGDVALSSNTIGSANTASGVNALFSNTNASNNTANGYAALMSNTTGTNNTASGANALLNNTTGSNNIALGYQAGSNLTTGDSNIDIGSPGLANDSGRIRIGSRGVHNSIYVAGIFGATVTGERPSLWTTKATSGRRLPRPGSRAISSRWVWRANPSWRCSR